MQESNKQAPIHLFNVNGIICKMIASSSKSNAYLYGDILVDCGISFKKLVPYINEINYIFITHLHGDHYIDTTVKNLLKQKSDIKIIAPREIMAKIYEDLGKEYLDNMVAIEPNKPIKNDKLMIFAIPVVHDDNMPCFAYTFKNNGVSFVHATDCGDVSHISFKNVDHATMEDNYNEDIINFNIEQARNNGEKWKARHLVRVKKTHLSTHQCDEWIEKNTPKSIFRAHISKRNNCISHAELYGN